MKNTNQQLQNLTTNKTSKTTSFLMLVVMLIAITLVSCKKEKDDPNITYHSINKTISNNTIPSTAIDSVDYDGNGTIDFLFGVFKISSDSFYVAFEGHAAALNLDTTATVDGLYIVNETTGTTTPLYIPGSDNYNVGGIMSYKFGINKQGIAGKGDRYVSFGFAASPSNIHYGWMKMNISADFKTFKIIDCAYSTLANTPITLGAK